MIIVLIDNKKKKTFWCFFFKKYTRKKKPTPDSASLVNFDSFFDKAKLNWMKTRQNWTRANFTNIFKTLHIYGCLTIKKREERYQTFIIKSKVYF